MLKTQKYKHWTKPQERHSSPQVMATCKRHDFSDEYLTQITYTTVISENKAFLLLATPNVVDPPLDLSSGLGLGGLEGLERFLGPPICPFLQELPTVLRSRPSPGMLCFTYYNVPKLFLVQRVRSPDAAKELNTLHQSTAQIIWTS